MIGLCSVTFRNKSPEEIVKLVKDEGLEVIEWASDSHIPANDTIQAKKIAKLMKSEKITTSSYGTYYQLGSFEDFNSLIKIAKIIGASTIRVWAGEQSSADSTNDYRKKIVEDAKRIGYLAKKANIKIGIEYHLNTLTDTPASAEQLMNEINLTNVLLYWQPSENLSVKERIESLSRLAPWIVNVHIFHWEDYNNRYPLEKGFEEWKQYIQMIDQLSPHNPNYLLEFVPGDQVQGYIESSDTLKEIINQIV